MNRSISTKENLDIDQVARLVGSPFRARMRALRKRLMWRVTVSGSQALKRIIDVVVSASALVALAPLFAVVAVAIKATDGGPILFWQTRVGRHG